MCRSASVCLYNCQFYKVIINQCCCFSFFCCPEEVKINAALNSNNFFTTPAQKVCFCFSVVDYSKSPTSEFCGAFPILYSWFGTDKWWTFHTDVKTEAEWIKHACIRLSCSSLESKKPPSLSENHSFLQHSPASPLHSYVCLLSAVQYIDVVSQPMKCELSICPGSSYFFFQLDHYKTLIALRWTVCSSSWANSEACAMIK